MECRAPASADLPEGRKFPHAAAPTWRLNSSRLLSRAGGLLAATKSKGDVDLAYLRRDAERRAAGALAGRGSRCASAGRVAGWRPQPAPLRFSLASQPGVSC